MAGYVYVRHPNDKLRMARLRQPSPSGSGRRMSRQELAQAVNDYYLLVHGAPLEITGDYVGRLERGIHRWPNPTYRESFRGVLRVSTDAELGFYICRRQVDDW